MVKLALKVINGIHSIVDINNSDTNDFTILTQFGKESQLANYLLEMAILKDQYFKEIDDCANDDQTDDQTPPTEDK